MGVRKFRSIEEMDAAVQEERARSLADFGTIAHVLETAGAGAPRQLAPGVYKHATVAEWNAQTDRWEAEATERAARRCLTG